jgi:4-hydroxybenzoate polyprenyltransferase
MPIDPGQLQKDDRFASAQGEVPLCVDLDGTLVKSDTLVDAVLLLVRQQPASPLQWPGWLAKGKAGFKREVTSRAVVDVEHLPYNRRLLEYLREERERGRRIYLATAADAGLAQKIADHLGLFDGVLASDGHLNLAGENKLAAFQREFPEGFTYIGNAMPDRHLLRASVAPIVANPHRGLLRALQSDGTTVAQEFHDRAKPLKVFLRTIRLHQWAKNALVFVPLLLGHAWASSTIVSALVAFLSLSFCASATYVINDMLDIEADRRHQTKRHRPFAAGDLSPLAGTGIIALFFAIAITLATLLPRIYAAMPGKAGVHAYLLRPHYFLLWLGIYTMVTLAYSFRLKRMVLIDVIVLSGLYTLRILAGSAATGVLVSTWLAAFSIFFFLSLAFVKRFSELESLVTRNLTKATGRGYHTGDLEQLRSFGTASGYASVVVLTMYISNLDSQHLYMHSNRLWLIVPVLILWLSRVWLLTARG